MTEDFTSIVMLNFRKGDRSKVSRRCIDALFENTTVPFELILVDNTCNNRGLSRGRNFGASLATGKYIAFMDDDILVLPGWLEECLEMLQQGDKFLATPVHQRCVKKWDLGVINGWRINQRTGSNCMVMRRSAFDDIGNFPVMTRSLKYDSAKTGKVYASTTFRKGYTFLVTKERKAIDLGAGKHSYEDISNRG